MKRFLLFLLALSLSFSTFAQSIRVNGYETILNPKSSETLSEDLKRIQHKKYLSQDYKPALVDDFKQKAFLRYNIFEDEMEFVKDETIYYIQKAAGRKIQFMDNTLYKVYTYNGKPQFFLVHQDGENALLAKQEIKFIEAKKATSSYGSDKPADFKRGKDELFLAIDNKTLVKLSKNKKAFYNAFGDKAGQIKKYVKANKLKYKSMKDLKDIIAHYNTL